jgi:hypothetical protein
MDQRVSLITLGVSDLARSKKFYEDGLGWKPSSAGNEHVTFYDLGGMALGLFGRTSLAEDAKVAMGVGFAAITLAHNLRSREEVDALFQQALRAGARELKKPEAVFWGGYSGYFADPDGHIWEIAHNPGWTLDASGKLELPK